MSAGFRIGDLWFGMSVDTKPLTTGIRTSEKQVTTSLDKVERQAAGVGTAFTRVADGLGKLGLASLGLEALTRGVQGLAGLGQAAADDAAATERLQQSIRNLRGDAKGLAGDTAAITRRVEEAIAAGQKLGFTDDDIRDSFQFLATATGDATKALTRQKLAMDLARGANIPLAQATRLLGKVNAENVNAFRRMGIVIDENATEAQALAVVQKKFAGQADTFAQSTAGQFEQGKIALAEIKESIGTAVLPALAAVGRVLAENMPAIQEFIGTLASGIGERFGPALVDGIGMVTDAVKTFVGALRGDWAGQTSADIDEVTKTIGKIGLFISQTVVPALERLGAIAQKAISGDLVGAFGDLVRQMAGDRVDFAAQLVEWGQALIAWIAPYVPPLLAELEKLANEAFTWVQKQLPGWMKQLEAWGTVLVEWVKPLIPPLMDELGKLTVELLGWVAAQAQPLLQRFINEWVPSALGWVLDAAQQIVPELLKLSGKILDWIGAEGPGLASRWIREWVPAALKWTADLLVDVIPKLDQLLLTITEWVVKEGVPKAAKAFMAIGWAIIDGINDGITDAFWKLIAKLGELGTDALNAAKRAIEARSPSRLYARELGVPIAEGITAGLLSERDHVQRALAGLVAAPAMRLPALPDAGAGRLPALAGMARAGGMNVSAPLIGSISVRDDADMIALQEQIRQLPARLNEEWGQSWESITRSGYRRSPSHG